MTTYAPAYSYVARKVAAQTEIEHQRSEQNRALALAAQHLARGLAQAPLRNLPPPPPPPQAPAVQAVPPAVAPAPPTEVGATSASGTTSAPAPVDPYDLAAGYLRGSLADGALSDQEFEVYVNLQMTAAEELSTTSGRAVSAYVLSALSSGGLSADEYQLSLDLLATLRENPAGDAPGLQDMLGLLNDFAGPAGDTARTLAAPEFSVVSRLLSWVRSGEVDEATLSQLIFLVRSAALVGTDPAQPSYAGLSANEASALLNLWDSTPTDPHQALSDLLGDAVDPTWVSDLSDQQASTLLSQDPSVVTALAGAGMAANDIIRLAPTVSAEEVANPGFHTVLTAHLSQGESAIQSLTWARYTGLASSAELSDEQFRQDLTQAAANGQGDTLEGSVHYARANALVREVNGAIDLPDALALEAPTLDSLLAALPAVVQALLTADLLLTDVAKVANSLTLAQAQNTSFTTYLKEELEAGLPAQGAITLAEMNVARDNEQALAYSLGGLVDDPTWVYTLSEEEVSGLLTLDKPIVVAALANAGMEVSDIINLAPVVTDADVAQPNFTTNLAAELAKDDVALRALNRTIYAGVATEEELSSDAFHAGLYRAALFDNDTKTLESKAHWARCSVLFDRLEGKYELGLLDTLPDQQVRDLLAADPVVVLALLEQGMSVVDTIAHAATVTTNEAQNSVFTDTLRDRLDDQFTAAGAIAHARATMVAAHLNAPNSTFADGTDWLTVLELNLTGEQADNLLALSPHAVRTAMSRGGPLAEVADLTAEQLTKLNAMNADSDFYVHWLKALTPCTLSDIASLSDNDSTILQYLYNVGYRQTAVNETITAIQWVGNPIKLGDQRVVMFQADSGQKFIVSQQNDPAEFARAVGILLASKFDTYGIPTVGGQPVNEFSVLDLPSGVLVNPDDPSAGELTVQEAAQQAQYIEYKNGITDGSIQPDDVRAQFVDAIEAKAALDGGYDLIAYYEDPGIVGENSNREYPETAGAGAGTNADGQITYEVGAADAAELINADAVDAKIEILWNDPTIQTDFATHSQAVVDSLPNKDALATELSNGISSPEYLNALEDMADSGLAAEATQLTASNLSNLALLNPELATQTQTNLALSTVASELNTVLADPSLLDAESMGLAVQDSIELAIAGLRAGFGILRHTTGTIDYFAEYAQGFANDPKSVNALSATYKQLVIDAKNGLRVDLSNVSPAQFQSAMERAYIPAELRGGLTEFVAKAQNMGVWGSLSGGAMLASFGYKVANGAWDADSTATERWGAARDLISFGSVIGHVSKTGATVFDSVLTYFGANNLGGNAVWQALGLDRTLPELYGKTSLLPQEMDWSRYWHGYDADLDADHRPLIDLTGSGGNDLSPNSLTSSNPAVSVVDDVFTAKAPLTAAGTSIKIAGTVLKVIGATTDLFGVVDIVMGAIAAKQAVEAGDRPMAAVACLQAISGAFVAAAGVVGTAALAAPLSAALAGAAAPLFMAGAVAAVVALAIMIGVSVHRKNERRQENTEDQNAFFDRLADQGLTQSGYQDKLEYLHYAWSVYGNDNPTQDKSYFEYHHTEWQHFQNTADEHGSSINRLSEDLHVSNDLTVDGRVDPDTVSEWGSTQALVG